MTLKLNPEVSERLAKKLASLHIPGNPVVFTNVWDPPSLKAVLANPKTVAVATASFAIAESYGVDDDYLTQASNLSTITLLRDTLLSTGDSAQTIPFSVDAQDGYGPHLSLFISSLIDLGVVGINIEDVLRTYPSGYPDPSTTSFPVPASSQVEIKEVLLSPEEAAERVKTVIETAIAKGVPSFVVNARTDVVKLGGTIEEAIQRGKLYLEAGATTVFVWGGVERGLRDEEVRKLVEGLQGKVAVIHRRVKGFLSVKEIGELGVARISMGPGVWKEGQAAVKRAVDETLASF